MAIFLVINDDIDTDNDVNTAVGDARRRRCGCMDEGGEIAEKLGARGAPEMS